MSSSAPSAAQYAAAENSENYRTCSSSTRSQGTTWEEDKEGAPNPKHRPPPQFEVLGSFCSLQITRDELNNIGGKTIETTSANTSTQQTKKKKKAATTAATSNSKRTTSPPAKTKTKKKIQPVTPNSTASSLNTPNKKAPATTKKNKASNDDDDDDDNFYDPISSLDSAEEEEQTGNDDDAVSTPATRNTPSAKKKTKATTPASAVVMKRKKTAHVTPRTSSSQKKTKLTLQDNRSEDDENAADADYSELLSSNNEENKNNDDDDEDDDNEDDGSIHSRWKSIQGTVVKKMEQRLKSGEPFPKLPTTGVCYKRNKGTSPSYQVRLYFEKQLRHLGSWKRPEIAAQAYWYAKEFINDGDDDVDEEEKQELDRIRTVVKAEVKMKTNIDSTGNIALNQDSGNGGSVAMSSSQVSTAKKTSKQPEVKGYCRTKSGKYRVQVHYLGKKLYFGTYQSEREAAVAYTIAKYEILQSPVLQPLKTKWTAKDKEWKLIKTEIRRIMETATPTEMAEMLAILPKLMTTGYTKSRFGKFKAQICFEGKRRHIGNFKDESKAELAYSLAYHKKINYIPSSYSTTTAAASTSTSTSTTQMFSPTEEVSPQSTSPPPPLQSIGAATKRVIGAAVSSSTATTSNKRQKLSNINDYTNHHGDVSPNDNEAVGDGYTVPSAEPKKGIPAKLKAFLVITTATSSEGHNRLREEVVAINNTNRRRLTNPITTIAATSPVPSVLTTTTTLTASSSILSSQTTQYKTVDEGEGAASEEEEDNAIYSDVEEEEQQQQTENRDNYSVGASTIRTNSTTPNNALVVDHASLVQDFTVAQERTEAIVQETREEDLDNDNDCPPNHDDEQDTAPHSGDDKNHQSHIHRKHWRIGVGLIAGFSAALLVIITVSSLMAMGTIGGTGKEEELPPTDVPNIVISATPRYIVYSNLTDEQQQIVTEDLNYNKETWNVLGTDDADVVYI